MTDNRAEAVPNIPASAREFDRWFHERSHTWPPYLQRLGANALMSFHFLDQPEANRSPRTNQMASSDLFTFSLEFKEWRTRNPAEDQLSAGR